MLSDVIKRYGGEKMDPLDVYKDIFRIGEGFIQKEYEDSGICLQLYSFCRSKCGRLLHLQVA